MQGNLPVQFFGGREAGRNASLLPDPGEGRGGRAAAADSCPILVGLGGGTMGSGERTVLKQLTAGHSGMPETWFLEADPTTGAPLIGHTYWRVEEGGLSEGEDTERWPLDEAKHWVPDEVWQRAAEVAPRGARPAGPGAAADRPHD
jgi:hypothetical protein